MILAAQCPNVSHLTLAQRAKKARICPAYLRRIERQGGAPWGLANRLARLYGCDIRIFLYGRWDAQSSTK